MKQLLSVLLVLSIFLVNIFAQEYYITGEADEESQSVPDKPQGGRSTGRGRGRWVRGRARGRARASGGTVRAAGGTCIGGQVTAYNSNSGQISSPNFPLKYQSNMRCTYKITVSPGTTIRLHFDTIDIEGESRCNYDYVRVRDMDGTSMGRRCGTWTSPENSQNRIVKSSGNILYVDFKSDRDTELQGFKATWTAMGEISVPGCNGEPNQIVGETSGEIQSPNEDGQEYPSSVLCVNTIIVPDNQQIQLNLYAQSFGIEYYDSCEYDYLEIFDGPSTNSQLLGGRKLCGSPSNEQHFPTGFPNNLRSSGNTIIIIFKSDASVQGIGFKITWSAVPVTLPQESNNGGDKVIPACQGLSPTELTESEGIITSPNYGPQQVYPNEVSCKWIIETQKQKVIALTFEDFEVENHGDCDYDVLTIYNGQTEQSPVLHRLCGTNVPPSIQTPSNTVLLIFTSDASVAKKGFRITYSIKDPFNTDCGIPDIQPKLNKIVGGQTAIANSWPYMVALQKRFTNTWYLTCGGSIISPDYILTAAHCIDNDGTTENPNRFRIIAGDHDRSRSEGKEQIIDVQEIIKHPNYNHVTTDSDIALLKLSGSLTYNQYVKPICLPSSQVSSMALCAITGWGATQATGSAQTPDGSATQNKELNQAFVPTLSRDQCRSSKVRNSLTNNMFCAGYMFGGKDSCQGDSGGPLMCKEGGKYVQHGITSWGYGCAEANSPGVYTTVDNFVEWIGNYVTKSHSVAKRSTGKENNVESNVEARLAEN